MMQRDLNITFPALKVTQPIGDYFVGVIEARDLVKISVADVRRLNDDGFDNYIGIQRRLSSNRTAELKQYVNSFDACFPTAVVLAVPEENTRWDPESGLMSFFGTGSRSLEEVASIIDGQHRVEGLTAFAGEAFQVTISIFVGADLATQANIFATVNLAQTKVNRSLAYDLLDYEKLRSPQKTAHQIAVTLDQLEFSPYFRRVKRLGSATEGRSGETVTQAAIVESLLPFISENPQADRSSFFMRLIPRQPSEKEHAKLPFRDLFLKERDREIAQILINFFTAVRERWPHSWEETDRKGNVLPKSTGLKALMRFLKPTYLLLTQGKRDAVPTKSEFRGVLDRVNLKDDDFSVEVFLPGTSGEAKLYRELMAAYDQMADEYVNKLL